MIQRARFFFDNLNSAATGLLIVLQHARNNRHLDYRFGPMAASSVLENGLWLEGQIEELADSLEQVSGAVRHDE